MCLIGKNTLGQHSYRQGEIGKVCDKKIQCTLSHTLLLKKRSLIGARQRLEVKELS